MLLGILDILLVCFHGNRAPETRLGSVFALSRVLSFGVWTWGRGVSLLRFSECLQARFSTKSSHILLDLPRNSFPHYYPL